MTNDDGMANGFDATDPMDLRSEPPAPLGEIVEPPKGLPVFIVVQNTPAWTLLMRGAETGIQPGQIIPCSAEELASFRKDCLMIRVT